MALSLIYTFHLLCTLLRRINSPLFMVLVKGRFFCFTSVPASLLCIKFITVRDNIFHIYVQSRKCGDFT